MNGMTTRLSSRVILLGRRSIITIALLAPVAFAQAQTLTSPPTTVQNGGNFMSVTVNSGGNLTFTDGSVGANFLFPGTATVNSGGTFTGNNLTLTPGGGQTGLTVSDNVSGTVARAVLANSRITVAGGGTGVDVVATSGGIATATMTDTVVDLASAGGGKGLISNGSGATLTIQGALANVIASGGGGIPAIDALNQGRITILDGASVDLESDSGND